MATRETSTYQSPASASVVDTGIDIRPGIYRRVSWGAVFAGVIIALAVQLVLSMLGLGVGATTIHPTAGANGLPQVSSLGIGAAVWWTVSYLISLIIGGYVASRLAGVVIRMDGLLHGLVTWGFALLISAYLVTTAVGAVMGGAFRVLGSAASGVTQAVQQAAPEAARAVGVSPDDIRNQVQDLLRPANQQASGDAARSQLFSDLTTIVGGGPQADQARQQAASIIAQQAGIPPEQAQQRLQQIEQRFNQARQQAVQAAANTAEATTDTLSNAGIWGTVALLLGAAAAAIGGWIGTRKPRQVVVSAE